MNNFESEKFDSIVNRGNFLGAFEYVKGSELAKQEKSLYSSELASIIVEKLSKLPKIDKEGISFLRSILVYIFREFPGLASIYREQLRFSHGSQELYSGLLRGVKNVADVATGKKTVEEGLEDAGEDLKEGLDSDFAPGIESLAQQAAKGLEEGIKSFSEFIDSFGKPRSSRSEAENEDKEEEVPAQRVRVEDADKPGKEKLKPAAPPTKNDKGQS